jgi:hypothetical protein
MTHIETETLAMIAMGDTAPTAEDEAHLAVCSACADELSSLDRVVRLGRSTDRLEVVAPPAAVWDGIRDELGLAEPSAQAATTSAPAVTSSEAEAEAEAESEAGRTRETELPLSHTVRRPVAPRRGRRRVAAGSAHRRWLPVTAGALAVGLVAGLGLGLWWQTDRRDSAVVVADADLEAFPGWPGAAGTAVVDERPDGLRQVSVTVDGAAVAGAGLREVWLIETDGSGLVSIGYLTGAEGRFDVPRGLDLADYALVDVSAEQDDGDPAHSGDSIVRGELRLT